MSGFTDIKRSIKSIEVTPLAAYGIVALVFIMAWLGTERLSAATQSVKTRAQSAQSELAQLTHIQGTDIWAERLGTSEQFRTIADGMIWKGTTSGVIDASVQQSIREIAGKAKMTSVQLDITPPDALGNVDFMQFTLRGLIPDSDMMIDVFYEMAMNLPHIIATDMSMTIRQGRPSLLVVSGRVPIRVVAINPEEEAP